MRKIFTAAGVRSRGERGGSRGSRDGQVARRGRGTGQAKLRRARRSNRIDPAARSRRPGAAPAPRTGTFPRPVPARPVHPVPPSPLRVPDPDAPPLPRDRFPPGTEACDHCTGRCCRYFALPIDTPKTRRQFDFMRWYLVHGNCSIFVDGKTWFLCVHGDCEHLLPDHRCGIYETRPEICRSYSKRVLRIRRRRPARPAVRVRGADRGVRRGRAAAARAGAGEPAPVVACPRLSRSLPARGADALSLASLT